MKRVNRGQVWVETVIYTLIALAMIAAVLAFARPKIEELQDKARTDQALEIMNQIDATILSIVQGGPGNRRQLLIELNKGNIIIDSENEEVYFEMESKNVYSEPGKNVEVGNIIARTETQNNRINIVTLTNDYSNYNVTFEGLEQQGKLTQASTPYKLFISNRGKVAGANKTQIDFEIS